MLEIGSGGGYFHQLLLEQGAGSAVGVDLAPRTIEQARQRAHERKLGQRTRYVQGDFVTLDHELAPTDITILDKVVCCYPDGAALVHKSLALTRRVYALTYPRAVWYALAGEQAGRVLMWLVRSDFRAYVHDPAAVESWITAQGFRKRFDAQTPIWLTQVYEKIA